MAYVTLLVSEESRAKAKKDPIHKKKLLDAMRNYFEEVIHMKDNTYYVFGNGVPDDNTPVNLEFAAHGKDGYKVNKWMPLRKLEH